MRGKVEFDVIAESGGAVVVVNGATVTVRRESDAGLASISSDFAGSSGLSNPFTLGGSVSKVEFYAEADERYSVRVEATGLDRTLRYVSVTTPPVLPLTGEGLATSDDQVIPEEQIPRVLPGNLEVGGDLDVGGSLDVTGNISGAFPFPPGHIHGMVPANAAGDPTNDITFGVGSCRDSADSANLRNIAAITKQANAPWAVGDNAGMHPGGAATAWGAGSFHLFALGKVSDPAFCDFGMDSSVTAANLMANAAVIAEGIDVFRRICSPPKTAGAAWPVFTAADNHGPLEILLSVPVNDVNSTNPGTSAVLSVLSVPLGLRVWALGAALLSDPTPASSVSLLLTCPDQADTAPSSTLFTLRTPTSGIAIPAVASAPFKTRTDASGQVRYRIEASTDQTVRLTTSGYIDHRAD